MDDEAIPDHGHSGVADLPPGLGQSIRLAVVSDVLLTDVDNLDSLGQRGLTDDALPLQQLHLDGAVLLVAAHRQVDKLNRNDILINSLFHQLKSFVLRWMMMMVAQPENWTGLEVIAKFSITLQFLGPQSSASF